MTEEHQRYRHHDTQPIDRLDLPWDALMEKVTGLMLKGVEPTEISHIIDVAITAYLRGGQRKPLLLTQAEADLLFRLVRLALQSPFGSMPDAERAAGAQLQVRIGDEILES